MRVAVAGAAIMLDGRFLGGTPPGIGVHLRRALRHGSRRVAIVFASAVARAATVPFWILAIGAMPLSLPPPWVDADGPARAAAGLHLDDASGYRHSEHRAALRPRLRDIPGLA